MTGKILIVDDDLQRARKIKSILQEEGYRVPAITQAAQGVDQALSSEPDIILVDLGKNPKKAFEMCGRLRLKAETRNIPVVYLTSYKGTSDPGGIPFSDIILHDADVFEMKRTIRHLLIESAQSSACLEIMKEANIASAAPSANGLTGSEASVLSDGGFPLTQEIASTPIAKRQAVFSQMLDTSLTTAQAARRLGVNSSRVRQRLTSRPPTLYAIRDGAEWMLPAFQFDRDRLIPNFAKVIARIDAKIDPVALYRWFVDANVDLVRENEVLSPRQWLLSGLPWKRPAELASDL